MMSYYPKPALPSAEELKKALATPVTAEDLVLKLRGRRDQIKAQIEAAAALSNELDYLEYLLQAVESYVR